jgi:hypothetical protein
MQTDNNKAEAILAYVSAQVDQRKRLLASAKRKHLACPTPETRIDLDIALHIYTSLNAMCRTAKAIQ